MGFETLCVKGDEDAQENIIKQSLWDLKRDVLSMEGAPHTNNKAVPMGFETTDGQQ